MNGAWLASVRVVRVAVATSLCMVALSASAQQPVPLDFRCGADAAPVAPSTLPADALQGDWQRAEDGRLARGPGSACWLRIDPSAFAPRVLRVRGGTYAKDIVVFAHDGQRLATARDFGARDRVIIGSGDGRGAMLFPTLRATDGPLLVHLGPDGGYPLRFDAVDLADEVQAERDFDSWHLSAAVLHAAAAAAALVLGVLTRDRAFLLWTAIGRGSSR